MFAVCNPVDIPRELHHARWRQAELCLIRTTPPLRRRDSLGLVAQESRVETQPFWQFLTEVTIEEVEALIQPFYFFGESANELRKLQELGPSHPNFRSECPL